MRCSASSHLSSKPPNQGRGFAGKNAKRFEIKTNFGAILHDVVKSAYEKHQGKEPERGFFFNKEHVTSARILAERSSQTVKDFVVKCSALNSESLECTMTYTKLGRRHWKKRKRRSWPGSSLRERLWRHGRARGGTCPQPPRPSGSVGLPVPTPVQLIGKPVKNRREIWDCLEKLSWKRGNVKTTTFGSGSITLGVTRGAPGADGFNKEGYNDQVVPGCLSQGDQEQCAKLWELLQDEGRALGVEFSSAQLNKNFQPMHPHHHRRTDKDHQWCLSLGEFTAGEFCWQERDQCFSVSTKDQWQKVDGRHVHWVKPHQPESSVRYSIVLFAI